METHYKVYLSARATPSNHRQLTMRTKHEAPAYHLVLFFQPLPRPFFILLSSRSPNFRLAVALIPSSRAISATIWPGRYLTSRRNVVSCRCLGCSMMVPIYHQRCLKGVHIELTAKLSGTLFSFIPPFMNRFGSSEFASDRAW